MKSGWVCLCLALCGCGRALAEAPPAAEELPPPAAAARGEGALELARIWVVDDRLRVSLRVAGIDDPATWGRVTAELVRHVAHAYQQAGHDRVEAQDRVLRSLCAHADYGDEELEGALER